MLRGLAYPTQVTEPERWHPAPAVRSLIAVLQNVAINNVADVYTVSERNWLDPWRRIVSASAPREDALTATDDEASVERLLQVANDDGGALSVAVPGAETCQPRRR